MVICKKAEKYLPNKISGRKDQMKLWFFFKAIPFLLFLQVPPPTPLPLLPARAKPVANSSAHTCNTTPSQRVKLLTHQVQGSDLLGFIHIHGLGRGEGASEYQSVKFHFCTQVPRL